MLSRLQQERSELLQKLTAEPEWNILEEINRIFRQIEPEEQREVIKQIVHSIRVFPTYLTIEYKFPRSSDGACTARVHLPTKEL